MKISISKELDDIGMSAEAFRVYFNIICHVFRVTQPSEWKTQGGVA